MSSKRSRRRLILWSILGLAVLVLIGAAVVAVPILTHQSAGSSGQEVPDRFTSEVSATGEDGRTRVVSVESETGDAFDAEAIEPGDVLVVHGSGFDASIGIYVSICAIPSTPGAKPGPCLGGIPEGAEAGEAAGDAVPLSSVWITDAWAWRAFATHGYDSASEGTFTARLLVPPAAQEGLDCTASRCAITTRADHTAVQDRVQDMQLPVRFTGAND